MPRSDKPEWEDYKKMIIGKALQYSRIYGIEPHELISEGNLIFVKARNSFNDSLSLFSTYLWTCLNNGLRSFCQEQKEQMFFEYSANGVLPDGRDNCHQRIKNSIFIRQSIAALPPAGQYTMKLLMENPAKLGLDGAEPPRAIRGAIKNHLRSQGESWSATWQTLSSLKSIFEEVA
jgi:hypothetical protein